jgi:hypothetical protein
LKRKGIVVGDIGSQLESLRGLRKKLGDLSEDPAPWKALRGEVAEFVKANSPVGKLEPELRDAIRTFLDGLTLQLHLAREDQAAWEAFQWFQDTADPATIFAHGDPRYPWDDTASERELREPMFYWLASRVAYCAGRDDVAIAASERAWRKKFFPLDILDIAVRALWRSGARATAEKTFEKAHEFLMADTNLERAAGLEFLWNSLHNPSLSEPEKPRGKARGNKCVKRPKHWEFTFGGKVVHVPALRGVLYLATLLQSPGKAFPVLDLSMMGSDGKARWVGAKGGDLEEDTGLSSGILGDGGERTDVEGLESSRRELDRIRQELRAADASGDVSRSAHLKREIEGIEKEIKGSFWKRQPRKVGDIADKIRSAVGQAIRKAISEIDQVHPALGRHLRAIKTGRLCSYCVDPVVPWVVRF